MSKDNHRLIRNENDLYDFQIKRFPWSKWITLRENIYRDEAVSIFTTLDKCNLICSMIGNRDT